MNLQPLVLGAKDKTSHSIRIYGINGPNGQNFLKTADFRISCSIFENNKFRHSARDEMETFHEVCIY